MSPQPEMQFECCVRNVVNFFKKCDAGTYVHCTIPVPIYQCYEAESDLFWVEPQPKGTPVLNFNLKRYKFILYFILVF